MNGGINKRFFAVSRFFAHDIWYMSADRMSGVRRTVLFWIRICLTTLKGFSADNIPLHAAALTFYTLLSLVPLIAIAFGLARGFSIDSLLEREISASLGQYDQVATFVIGFARRYLETARSSLIAGASMAILAGTVIMMMGDIENSFNRIHRVRKSRTIIRKVADYLTIIFVGVILFTASSGLTVLGAQLSHGHSVWKDIPGATFLLRISLGVLPLILICTLLTILYKVMPNRHINIGPAIGGGVLAGIAYQFIQWLYLYFQIGVFTYDSIYGNFAALPLFIVWLQLSWTVILLGAEITRALSAGESYGFVPPYDAVSPLVKRLVTLRVLRMVIREASEGRHAVQADEIALRLMVPIPLVEEILEKMTMAELILHTAKGASFDAYTPAGEPGQYRVADVLESLETAESAETLSAASGKDGSRIDACLALLRQEMHRSSANLPLIDL